MSDLKYFTFLDTGGTFTDCAIVREDGVYFTGKSPTTPEKLEDCFFNAINDALEKADITPEEFYPNVRIIGYGTTYGTNIIVSGEGGPKLGLITTKGHEDRSVIMRLRAAGLDPIEGMHLVAADKPKPIIPRERIRGVQERIDCMGNPIVPLDEDSVRIAVKELIDQGVEGIAVCLLFSYINDKNEKRIKEIINQMAPDIPVSISSEVSPITREYPRIMSTEIDLYIGAPLRTLLESIKEKLVEKGYTYPFLIMQAAGGLARSEVVKPATTLHSGPVSGLSGVDFLKEQYGISRAIGVDMGGTSFDISISGERGAEYLREPIVGRFQISNPMKEIITIGAGGGTIAYIEESTMSLRVGPQSAGAFPGPVCYGLGGQKPTVTDANVVLGRIDPDYFWGGKRKLNKEAAEESIKEKIAQPLGLNLYEAAEGIINIIDTSMEAAVEAAIAAKGLDPATFSVFVFGGAGPMQASGLFKKMKFRKIIIPKPAPVFCAFGASTTDVKHRYETSPFVLIPNIPYDDTTLRFRLESLESLDLIPEWSLKRFNDSFEKLEQDAVHDMLEEGFKEGEFRLEYEMLARYGGQLWEIRTHIPVKKIETPNDLIQILRSFEEDYIRIYTKGAMVPRGGIEIITIAIEAIGSTPKPRLFEHKIEGDDPAQAIKKDREVYLEGNWFKVKVYDWDKLKAGNLISGPAIIESEETTLNVGANKVVRIDKFLNAVLEEK